MQGHPRHKSSVTDHQGLGDRNDLLDAKEACARLQAQYGDETPSLQTLKTEWRLFCVICAGVETYPAFQWYEGRLICDLRAILGTLLPHRTAWKTLSWFESENTGLGGARPADLLPLDPQAVLEAAQMELRRK
jgi:hypothetical protein